MRSAACHCIRAGLLAAGLAAFGTAAAGAQTKEISILGQWEIVEAIPAPWADEKNHAAPGGRRNESGPEHGRILDRAAASCMA